MRAGVLERSASFYPEREAARESLADRAWSQGAFWCHRWFRRNLPDPTVFAGAVAAHAARVPIAPLADLVPDLRYRLRRLPLSDDLLAECFALYCVAQGGEPAARVLGAARALVLGGIVELGEVAERRSALAFAAAAMALHGTPVHVLSASPSRAATLAELLQAPFGALGFRVALVTQDGATRAREDARARLVLCGTLRDIGLDYLRDRIALGRRPRTVLGTLDRVAGDAPSGHKLLLLGMQCALVEDADEVMLDDSRVPVTVATQAEQPGERLACEQALEFARTLQEAEDFTNDSLGARLTSSASQRLEALTRALGGAWALRQQREELVTLALHALHLLQRDRDYRVSRGQVVFPPRSPEEGEADPAEELLQRLVEVKEGCRLSGRRVVLAQMTAPRVLGRYLHLAGTCADARRLEPEFWGLYRLKAVRAGVYPTPMAWQGRLLTTRVRQREVLLEQVRSGATQGSVVVAARSLREAQAVFDACNRAGTQALLVRGEGTPEEQQAIDRLDEPGAVLVTVYPAERNVARAQGSGIPLRLIVAELHDAERHIVRIARAYGADSCEMLLSLEDDAIKARLSARALAAAARSPDQAKRFILRALRSAEQAAAQARSDAASMDRSLDDLLAFSGQRE